MCHRMALLLTHVLHCLAASLTSTHEVQVVLPHPKLCSPELFTDISKHPLAGKSTPMKESMLLKKERKSTYATYLEP